MNSCLELRLHRYQAHVALAALFIDDIMIHAGEPQFNALIRLGSIISAVKTRCAMNHITTVDTIYKAAREPHTIDPLYEQLALARIRKRDYAHMAVGAHPFVLSEMVKDAHKAREAYQRLAKHRAIPNPATPEPTSGRKSRKGRKARGRRTAFNLDPHAQ